jgi:hypothetical protein
MKYKFLFFTYIALFIILLMGCSSSNVSKESKYQFEIIDSILKNNNGIICAKLEFIDDILYKEYNIMTFFYVRLKLNKIDTILFVVISAKEIKDTINLKDFDSLKENEKYCLSLAKENTPIKVEFMIRGAEIYKQYLDYESKLVFYEKGYIVAKVFSATNIKGVYILKDKK